MQKYFRPLLLKPTDMYNCICSRVMPRAKKGQQKLPTLKKTTGFCPSGSFTLWVPMASVADKN